MFELETAKIIPIKDSEYDDVEVLKRINNVLKNQYEMMLYDRAIRGIFKTNMKLIQAAYKTSDFKDVVNLTFSNVCGDESIPIEYRILWIRQITKNQIIITYAQFPWFKDFLNTYGKLLRNAKTYKEV